MNAGALILTCAALTTGCGAATSALVPTADVPVARVCFTSDYGAGQGPANEARASTYFGLTLQQAFERATKDSLFVRVLAEDGDCPGMLTLDGNPNRLNVELTDGSVTSAAIF